MYSLIRPVNEYKQMSCSLVGYFDFFLFTSRSSEEFISIVEEAFNLNKMLHKR